MAKIPVALQMYTVRDQMAADFAGTFKEVAKIGYTAVELGMGAGNLSGADLKKFLDDCGLKLCGVHVPIDALDKDLINVLKYILPLGIQYVICPWMPEDRRNSAAMWQRTGRVMASIGTALKSDGLQLCYHNHSFEFQKFDGKYGFDIFYEYSEPAFVQAELDTYWIQHGGEKPAEYIRKYADRCPLIHLKDMLADEQKTFAEVGKGILDWPAIFKACEASVAKWYIVEQDRCQRPPMESAKISFENLKKMKIA
jgi:sugar phosphate isomerase/epimerase